MELTFNKVGKQYEAEFELTADANLHIEFESATPVKLYQRTTGGGWDLVNDVKNAVGKATDVDLQALIYPKFIKVVCPSNPSYCAVTSDGEITEIKSQSKEIEVTANGTTEITPDAGFAYLNGVKVKTNVPMSGGGSSFEYLDITNVTGMNGQLKGLLCQMAYMGKVPQTIKVGSNTFKQGIAPISGYMTMVGSFDVGSEEFTQAINVITAISIDFSATINMQGQVLTIQEMFAMYGVQSDIDTIPRLTEEEFYNLNA